MLPDSRPLVMSGPVLCRTRKMAAKWAAEQVACNCHLTFDKTPPLPNYILVISPHGKKSCLFKKL